MLRKLFGSSKPATRDWPVGAAALDERGCFRSDAWYDQPDAHDRIAAWARKGSIDAELAEAFRHFVDRGYLTLDLDLPDRIYTEIDADVDRLWSEKPADVAFAYQSRLTPFVYADETKHRRPGCRIADLHSYSPAAREIYLHPRMFEVVNTLFGEPALATQSLYFQFGSYQQLHRDPVHVPATPPWHLLAAWVALEDIDPRSSVLAYVPGSHRLGYYRFPGGDYRFDAKGHGDAEAQAMAAFEVAQYEAAGLQIETFVPKRGGLLVWHHSLLHGGPKAEDQSLTRKSFVVHFTTRSTMPRRRGELVEMVPDASGQLVSRLRMIETEDVLEQGNAAGFDNPLKKYRVRSQQRSVDSVEGHESGQT